MFLKSILNKVLGYGVIGSTEDFDSSSLGSSPDTLVASHEEKAITWILISKLPPVRDTRSNTDALDMWLSGNRYIRKQSN